jgi:hypothetical protein
LSDPQLPDKAPSVKYIYALTTGDPATRIIEHARNGRAGLIRMPTHGYGVFRRFLCGLGAREGRRALESWPAIENVSLRSVLCGPRFSVRREWRRSLRPSSLWLT